MIRRFRVGQPAAGTRLDVYLASVCSDFSRSRIQKLIEEGAARIAGQSAKRSHVVRAGDAVEIEVPELRPGIVHRLDRDTSGVLLVAKSDLAHASLSRQMKKRAMRKEYLALVAGVPKVRKGEVAFAIARDPRDRKKMKAFRRMESLPAGAREARTLYEVEREWSAPGLTLLRCRLITGRTHQIRVHLAAEGLPIVGDPVYGRPRYDRVKDAALKKNLQEFPRQALHAERIAFRHPATNEPIDIVAPIPEDLRELITAIDTSLSS